MRLTDKPQVIILGDPGGHQIHVAMDCGGEKELKSDLAACLGLPCLDSKLRD